MNSASFETAHQSAKTKFIIGPSFPLASDSLAGIILVGQPTATLSTSVRGKWLRVISPSVVALPE
jgi:hypothetical protein